MRNITVIRIAYNNLRHSLQDGVAPQRSLRWVACRNLE